MKTKDNPGARRAGVGGLSHHVTFGRLPRHPSSPRTRAPSSSCSRPGVRLALALALPLALVLALGDALK